MWIFTQNGFISAVEARDKQGLSVRARDEQSLQHLIETAGSLGYAAEVSAIVEGAGTDYPFRVAASRAAVAAYLVATTSDIGYHNFKDQVTATRGTVFHDALMDVWIAMLRVTPLAVATRERARQNALYKAVRYRGKTRGKRSKGRGVDFLEPDVDRDAPSHLLDIQDQSYTEWWDDHEAKMIANGHRKSIHDMTDAELEDLSY